MAARLVVLALLGALLALPSRACAQPAVTSCADLRATHRATDRARPLAAEDLIGLIDIGDPSPSFDSAGLSLSPNGRSIAVPIRQAYPGTNSYCLAIVLLDRSGVLPPTVIDRSAELIFQDFDNRGTLQPHDYPLLSRPKWSPDGRAIAYQKSVGGVRQLWRINIVSGVAKPILGTSGELLDFAWSSNATIVIARRAGLAQAQHAIAEERLTGYRYDERFLPMLGAAPYPLTSTAREYRSVDVETGDARPARDAERVLLDPVRPAGALRIAHSDLGSLAWTASAQMDRYLPETMLIVRFRGEPERSCGPELCDQVQGLWWEKGRERLAFVRREGWGNADLGLYEWRRGQERPRRIFRTTALLVDCQPTDDGGVVCGTESAVAPRTIVELRMRNGAMRTLYEPNPNFALLSKGRVERLRWTFAEGAEGYGDLVYPVGYRPGSRYPTIVTTYTSRGFLRGGTGDEYPIQLFANHGFAVLSFARPAVVGRDVPGIATNIAAMRLAFGGWADRRNVQAALEGGLRALDTIGLRDASKTGITGLSDGTAIVQFALLNSMLFSAAAMSSCCVDAEGLAATGLNTADYFHALGLPLPDEPQSETWAPMSLSLNAKRLDTPLLLQMPSDEFRLALPSYTALRARRQPVEMYVYSEEGHVKQQPAHKLAIYQRNLAWFEFWFHGKVDPGLVTPPDLDRWASMMRLKTASAQLGTVE